MPPKPPAQPVDGELTAQAIEDLFLEATEQRCTCDRIDGVCRHCDYWARARSALQRALSSRPFREPTAEMIEEARRIALEACLKTRRAKGPESSFMCTDEQVRERYLGGAYDNEASVQSALAALASRPQPSADDEQRARELLAAWLKPPYAALMRSGRSIAPAEVPEHAAIGAVIDALLETPR